MTKFEKFCTLICYTMFITLVVELLTFNSILGYKYRMENIENQNLEKQHLQQFIIKTMELAKTTLSVERKASLSKKIAEIVYNSLDSKEAREAFIVILSIESRFNSNLKSSAGAIGMSQIMSKYFISFGKSCNLEVVKDDINNEDLNIKVGACHFNELIKANEGSIMLSVAGYNAGMSSETIKNLKKFHTMNNETSNYVAKFAYVNELLKK